MTAGNRTIAVTRGAAGGLQPTLGVLWLTVKDVDPTPVASATTSAADVPPHATPGQTVPANGVELGFVNYIGLGSTVPTIGIDPSDTASALIRSGYVTYQNDGYVIAAAKRASSGAISFTTSSGYGGPWRTSLVFKAAGT